MAISGPKGSSPTHRGWVSAGGELLKAQKIGKAAITEWHMLNSSGGATEEQVQDMITEGKIQAAMADHELSSMSKKQLEDLGREHGVELDRRQSKKSLVTQMKGIITSK